MTEETTSFASVWDAIEDSAAEAANMKARSEIMIAVQEIVRSWETTQADAANRLGVTQPRLNDLLRGKVDRFSLDALTNLAAAAGLSVEWSIKPAA